jgi:hypothetical protein
MIRDTLSLSTLVRQIDGKVFLVNGFSTSFCKPLLCQAAWTSTSIPITRWSVHPWMAEGGALLSSPNNMTTSSHDGETVDI